MTRLANPRVAAVGAPPVAEAQSWAREGRESAAEPLMDLAQAVPSYPPSEALTDHIARVARRASTSLYSEILGLPALREALAAHLGHDYGAALDPACVAITSGCNQAFCVTVSALAGPGDQVILPLPYYFNHRMWLDMQGIRSLHLPFDPEHPQRLRVEAVQPLLTDKTRAMVLVSPNNPSGAEFAAGDIEAVHGLLAERGVTLVLDETYKDFRSRPGPPHRLLQLGAHRHPGFVQLYSFSKAYAMTGYRVGAVIAAPALLAEIEKILDCIAICPPRISQEAAVFALANLDGWRGEKVSLMRERLEILRRVMDHPGVAYELVSSGAYFAYVRHPFQERPAVDVARGLAERYGVLSLPGSFFGPGQERYLRLAFANVDGPGIEETARRLAASAR